MAIAFHESNLVLIGTFNIYIIRPDWLGKLGFLPEGSEVKFESQLNQPGFRLQSPALRSKWMVTPTRLSLSTDDPNEDCGRTADRILEALPWTPLMAMGFNFSYRGQPADIAGWEGKTAFPPVQSPEGYDRKQRSWHIGLTKQDQAFNLQVSELEECVELRVNVHSELTDKPVEYTREIATRFFEFRKVSKELLQHVFDARIDNAPVNDG